MAERVTIQDIADALGISRNTVSKAINNTGILAEATREKILKKAAEMGYKQFSYLNREDLHSFGQSFSKPGQAREIALFTTVFLGKSYFITSMLETFQTELSRLGYTLSIHRILSHEVDGLKLPSSFDLKKTAGIICFEIFDYSYANMLCRLNIPMLFVDCPSACVSKPLKTDRLFADNQTEICAFVIEMAKMHKKKIGFVGECQHCQSFFERYMGYRNGLFLSGLPCEEKYCILGNKKDVKSPTSEDYQEYLTERLDQADDLPEVFVCANDFVAADLLQVLKRRGVSVPKDLCLCGFDDSPESRIITPALTTVHIHSESMGISAVQLLTSRIQNPSLPFRTLYTPTELIHRESSRPLS